MRCPDGLTAGSPAHSLVRSWAGRVFSAAGAVFLAGLLAGLAAASSAGPAWAADKLKVVTTFTVIADMAKTVAGDAAQVDSITKPGAEIHNYQPTPGDLIKAQGANLILWNGLNLELWFEKFFSRLKGVPSVVVSDGVGPWASPRAPTAASPIPVPGCRLGRPHLCRNNIRDALVKYDPANAATYKANAEAYKAKITATIAPIRAELDKVPADQRWLVTSEGAFSYLKRGFRPQAALSVAHQRRPAGHAPAGAPRRGPHAGGQDPRHLLQRHHFRRARQAGGAGDRRPLRRRALCGSLSDAAGPVPTYLDLLRVTHHHRRRPHRGGASR